MTGLLLSLSGAKRPRWLFKSLHAPRAEPLMLVCVLSGRHVREEVTEAAGLSGRRALAGSGVLQRDPLKHLGLRRVAVDGLSQYVERDLMGHRQR